MRALEVYEVDRLDFAEAYLVAQAEASGVGLVRVASLCAPDRGQHLPMAQRTSKYLPIYLNDHLTGSTFALELAGRAANANRGSELGDFLARLRGEIAADRHALEEIMGTLGVSKDQLKRPVGWIAEKVGRLKLNGELLRRSPLSQTLELELLSLGIEGKRLMWLSLAETHADRIGADRLAALVARAEEQRAGVERHRLAAAAKTLS
jgi:hypothetical protein